MIDNSHQLTDSYNKSLKNGQGTLVGNWWEERELRDNTGIGRQAPSQHVPKKRDELYSQLPQELQKQYSQINQVVQNDTNERIFGQKNYAEFYTNNSSYGKDKNRALEIPQLGKKTQLIEKQYIQQIVQEIQEKKVESDNQQNIRHFNQTYKETFVPKELGQNLIGRRVMKDQNNQPLMPGSRDIEFLIQHGMINPTSSSNKIDEIKKEYQQESYVQQIPLTIYTEKQNDGYIYMSKQSGHSSFGLNNEFVKQFPHYSHIKK